MDVITTLRRSLERRREQVLFAYLFGSLAEGKEGPLSDVDVAVFLTEKFASSHFDVKLSLLADFCRALGRNDVDVVVLNHARNLMLLDGIIRGGVVLLDQDPRLRADFELRTLHRAMDFRAQRAAVMGF